MERPTGSGHSSLFSKKKIEKEKSPKMTPPNPSLPLRSIFRILLLALLISFKALARKTPSFFIFGDSTVDAGNNKYINTIGEFRAISPPYGQSYFLDNPTGRFSDGRIIVDFLAEKATLPLIPPFKQPSADFIKGVNFASGGAGVLQETFPGVGIDLPTQLKNFDCVVSSLTAELGDAETRELLANAVYFISIGTNDYLNYAGSTKMQEIFTTEDFVGMVIGNLSRAFFVLYDKGARKFGVLSLFPLGCMPALRAANPKADGSCFEGVSEVALAHNSALSGVIVAFQHMLKDLKYAFSSGFYDMMHEAFLIPTEFGLKDGMNACCGSGPYGGEYSCGGKDKSAFSICNSSDDFVWWDSYHLTEKASQKIADALWDGVPSFVGPYSLKALFFDDDSSRVENFVDNQEEDNIKGLFGL